MAKNQSLQKMFSKLKDEIMSKFEEKFEQQMNQIEKLKGKLEKQVNRIKVELLTSKTFYYFLLY